jgi:hypothetical protein
MTREDCELLQEEKVQPGGYGERELQRGTWTAICYPCVQRICV